MGSHGEDVYATLLLNDTYLPGALVLAHSLKDAGTTKKVVVLVTTDTVSAGVITQLEAVFDQVIPIERVVNESPANLYLMGRPDLHSTFTKIALWKLTQFRKIVYVDADIVALRAPDELFDIPHAFSAAPDIGWPDIFNTGLMVLTPNMGDYYALTAMAQRGISFDGADQGLLNMHFKNTFNRISFTYNVTPSAHYQYLPAYRHFQSSISLAHFIGQKKPWTEGRDAHKGSTPYDEMVGRWWAVYDRHFREASTDSSSGSSSTIVQYHTKGEFLPVVPIITIEAPPTNSENEVIRRPPTQEHVHGSTYEHTPESSYEPRHEVHHGPNNELNHGSNHGHNHGHNHGDHDSNHGSDRGSNYGHNHGHNHSHNHGHHDSNHGSNHGSNDGSNHGSNHGYHRSDHGSSHDTTHGSNPGSNHASNHQSSSDFAPQSSNDFTRTPSHIQEEEAYVHAVENHVDQGKQPEPYSSWDASKAPPPVDSRPEASNFPVTHYDMSSDPTPWQAPEKYPDPPKDMWYEVPKTPTHQKLAPIFPWEKYAPPPTRSFPEDKPLVIETEHSESSLDDTDKSVPVTPTTPTISLTPADPWGSYGRGNAWDDIPEIERYIGNLQKNRKGNIQVLQGYGSGISNASGSGRRGSMKLTDFPTELERPSLPVTPAPIRRPSFWGEEKDTEGQLPGAIGVPSQEEWDPVEKLEQLARRQADVLRRELGGEGAREIPTRMLPYGSEGVISPTYVKPTSTDTTSPLVIEEPSYHGAGAVWEKDETFPSHVTAALPSEEERDVLDN